MENNNPLGMNQKNSCPYINRPPVKYLEKTLNKLDIYLPKEEDDNQEEILDDNIFTDDSSKQQINDEPFDESHFFFTKPGTIQNFNNINNPMKENTIKNELIKVNPGKKIFETFGEKKREIKFPFMGRKRKNKSNSYEKGKKKSHTKFDVDNIMQKIKIKFLKCAVDYANKLYEKYQKKKCEKLIKKMKRKYRKILNNQEKKVFISKKLSEIFSGEISGSCSKEKNKNYNKENIEKLMEIGEPKELIDFLNTTVEDAYNIFIREGKDIIPEFNYQNLLGEFKNDEFNEKGESYKQKFRNVAKTFLETIKNSR